MTTESNHGAALYGFSTMLSPEQVARLAMLIPKIELKDRQGTGGTKFYYVDKDYVRETLDLVFGPDGWSFEIRDAAERHSGTVSMTKYVEGKPTTVPGASTTVTCTGRLTVTLRRDGVVHAFSREDIGGATNAMADPDKGTTYGDMLENVYKSASTDALKRAAAALGYALGRNVDKTGQSRVSNLDAGTTPETNVAGQGHGRTTVSKPAAQQRTEPAKTAAKADAAKPDASPTTAPTRNEEQATTPAAGAQQPSEQAAAGKPAEASKPAETTRPNEATKPPAADERDPWEGNINGQGGSPIGQDDADDVTRMPRPPSLEMDDDFGKIRSNEDWTRFFRILQSDYVNATVKPIEEAIYRLARAKTQKQGDTVVIWHNTLVERLLKRVAGMEPSNEVARLQKLLHQLIIPTLDPGATT